MNVYPFRITPEVITKGGNCVPSFDVLTSFVGFHAVYFSRQNDGQVAINVSNEGLSERFRS
jgi:hypothetical protein